jgi:hypothetical protein
MDDRHLSYIKKIPKTNILMGEGFWREEGQVQNPDAHSSNPNSFHSSHLLLPLSLRQDNLSLSPRESVSTYHEHCTIEWTTNEQSSMSSSPTCQRTIRPGLLCLLL